MAWGSSLGKGPGLEKLPKERGEKKKASSIFFWGFGFFFASFPLICNNRVIRYVAAEITVLKQRGGAQRQERVPFPKE